METAAPVTREIHLQQLRPFHESLVAALSEAGLGGSELAGILGRDVIGECVQCGVRVTGEDIAAALAIEAPDATEHPKYARLLHQYCVRKDCASYYYRFSFLPVTGQDWDKLLTRAEHLRAGRREAERMDNLARDTELRAARRVWLARLGAGLIGVVGAWAAWRWLTTGTLPGVKAKPKYQIDPSSLPPEPGGRAP